MRSLHSAPLLCTLLGALACSGGEATDAGVTPTPDSGEAPHDSGVSDPIDSGTPDSGVTPTGDQNDSIEQAQDVGLNVNAGYPATIGQPGDRDYYYLDGAAGTFVRIYTNSYLTADGDRVDTVLRLYDANKTPVAENDDAVPRANVNSEIIYRLPADGRYFIEVLEWSDWAGDPPEGRPDFNYVVFARTVKDVDLGTTIEVERGNGAASAVNAELLNRTGLVCGFFDADDDVDVFHFTLDATSVGRYLHIEAMPSGPTGYGATHPVGQVWLTDASGADVIARRDLSGDDPGFSPATGQGEYLVFLKHPGGGAGANDFYVVKPQLAVENDPEAEPNDTLETAEPRTLTFRQDAMNRADFVLAHLPAGDVDHFSIAPAANETVTVICGSRSLGSGVEGLKAELLTPAGAAIASATEAVDGALRIEDQVVTSTVVVVRLSKSGQSAELSGDYVRCGLYANPM
jgi:hypothetical protein